MNIFKEKYDLYTLKGIQLVVKYGFIATLLVILYVFFGIMIEDPIISYIILIPNFIFGLVYLYGYFLILTHRREFNIKHQKNVFKSFIIFVIYNIIIILLGEYYPISDLIKMYSPITNNIMIGFVSIFFIIELTESKITKILWMVIPLIVIINIIKLVFSITNVDMIPASGIIYNIIIIISIIPNLIIIYCYYKTLKKLTNNLPRKTAPSDNSNN